jgi:hypothetical protein
LARLAACGCRLDVSVRAQKAFRFEKDPCSIEGGSGHLIKMPIGKRTDEELKKQCTVCGFRFDCTEYRTYLGKPNHPDIRLDNVRKIDATSWYRKRCMKPSTEAHSCGNLQNVLASKYIRRQAVAEFEDFDGTELGISKSSPRDPSVRDALWLR